MPTFREAGFQGVVATNWFGFSAPAGIPPEIARRWETEIGAALKSDEVKEKFAKIGVRPGTLGAEAYTALIRSELEDAGFSRVVIETRAEQSRASSPRLPAVAYCQGTLLRNEIEARDAGKLEAATETASAIANRHGSGEVAAKIQAHVIVAAGSGQDIRTRRSRSCQLGLDSSGQLQTSRPQIACLSRPS